MFTGVADATSPATAHAAAASVVPVGDSGRWSLIFDDEFDATSLDTNHWSTGWFGSGITQPVNPGELECYDPSQVSEGGGELALSLIAKPEACGGVTRPYASGIVTTDGKFSFTYGYVEARVWLAGDASISDWPAVWADGQTWPQDGELDVLEGLGGSACWHFHDTRGGPGGCAGGLFTGGWHTFGADWEPGSVTYYYDGRRVGRIANGITGSPMYLILNLAASGPENALAQAPASLQVDYVRVWRRDRERAHVSSSASR